MKVVKSVEPTVTVDSLHKIVETVLEVQEDSSPTDKIQVHMEINLAMDLFLVLL